MTELVPVHTVPLAPTAGEGDGVRRRAEGLAVRWLHGYTTARTRNSYAVDIGLSPELRAALPGGPARPGPAPEWAWIPWALDRGIDPAGQLTRAHAEAYAHALHPQTKRSRQRRWAALCAFYRFLRVEEVVTCNPDEMVRRRTMGLAGRPPSPTLPLDPRQVQALYLAASLPARGRERNRALLAVLAATGCRAAELVDINLDDYKPQVDGHALIRLHGKGEKERWVLLPAPDAALVAAYLEVRVAPVARSVVALPGQVSAARRCPEPLFTTGTGARLYVNEVGRTLGRLVKRPSALHPDPAVRKAARLLAPLVGKLHPHQLRHTYATVAEQNGVPVSRIQADLGHARLDTTQTYLHAQDVEHSAARMVSGIYHDARRRPNSGDDLR